MIGVLPTELWLTLIISRPDIPHMVGDLSSTRATLPMASTVNGLFVPLSAPRVIAGRNTSPAAKLNLNTVFIEISLSKSECVLRVGNATYGFAVPAWVSGALALSPSDAGSGDGAATDPGGVSVEGAHDRPRLQKLRCPRG